MTVTRAATPMVRPRMVRMARSLWAPMALVARRTLSPISTMDVTGHCNDAGRGGADARVRAGPPVRLRDHYKKADGGVGRGPGGPPHWQSSEEGAAAEASL